MHRLFLPPERIARAQEGPLQLTPSELRHLRTVLRLAPGDELEVFDGRGGRWRGRLVAAIPEPALELGARLPAASARKVDVALAQALVKGEKMDFVVQKATELGASRIVPLALERSVVRLGTERSASRAERWRRIAREAARQCGRSEVPAVETPLSLDQLFTLLAEDPDRRALHLDPAESGVRLGAAARGIMRLLVAVGPEGGFSAAEKERAERSGFLPVSLGPLVLRTETAGLAALAIIQHLHGELG